MSHLHYVEFEVNSSQALAKRLSPVLARRLSPASEGVFIAPTGGTARMIPEIIRRKRDQLAGAGCHVNWCNDDELNGENMPGVGPGGDINPFGWYVIGTTGGGNGVVVHSDDPGVYFADHEWCGDGTAEGTRRELIPLAPSIEAFLETVDEMAARLDKIG